MNQLRPQFVVEKDSMKHLDGSTVYIVDDEEIPRKSVSALVRSVGLDSLAFESAEDFLAAYEDDKVACLVVDIRMQGMTGLELLEYLRDRDITIPTVVITAYARTRTTVKAMKLGAVTLIEKPYEEDDLLDAIRAGLKEHEASRAELEEIRSIEARLQTLTAKEMKVLERIIEGSANKNIASDLEVSLRTVESRRSSIFQKMQADSLAELVAMIYRIRAYREKYRRPQTH